MNKPVVLSIVGIFIVAVAIVLNFVLEWGDEDHARRTAPSDRPAASVQASSKPAPGPTAQHQQAESPTFDVVRINPQGDAVMAGRAKPGTRVEIYQGDQKIGEVEADRRGEWVFVPDHPLAPGNRRLSLVMRDKDGSAVAGAADVVIVVPERGKEGSQALAMRVPKEGQPGSVEILQKPAELAAASPTASPAPVFSVDAVDYDGDGRLDIVGKAPPGSLVQLYLNNEFLGRTQANERGQWSLKPESAVGAGNHLLRADQVDKDGTVTARMEVHFARAQPLKDVQPGALVVVKEGNSLWRIARRTYGSGFRYTDIFEANREQIKNADLIYPGQVFKLPQMN